MSDQDTYRQMLQRIAFLYGERRVSDILDDIESVIARYVGKIKPRKSGWSQADAFLITYADSLCGLRPPLETLHAFLRQHVRELMSFVHLLPFYPYSSDDGFAVQDFRAVREQLGSWGDIAAMAEDYRLVFDGVINHVSASSEYMRGYCRGEARFRDFFIELDPDTDTSSVLRTRDLPLLHNYPTSEGVKWLWTTFSRDQVDLNFANPSVLIEIIDVLLMYAARGASMIRLDAIPYLWKQLGTSCAHLPQTHELIKLIRDVFAVAAPHVLLLTETNVPHHENVAYFGEGGDEAQVIYNFALAPLILWSLLTGNARVLSEWAAGLEWVSPRATYLNMTATHDGIGMRPIEGILPESARDRLVQLAYDHGGDVTGKRNTGGSVSPYELNISYFDAVNDPRSTEPMQRQIQRFLVSQAIPMAMMGVPAIYIHSLLGSRNDYAGVQQSGRARSINREQIALGRLQDDLAAPTSLRAQVFAGMKRLLTVRSSLSAFHPDARQEILDLGPGVFAVQRANKTTGDRVVALHNVCGTPLVVSLETELSQEPVRDAITGQRINGRLVTLEPYGIRWLQTARVSEYIARQQTGSVGARGKRRTGKASWPQST